MCVPPGTPQDPVPPPGPPQDPSAYVLNRYSRIPGTQPRESNTVFRLVNPVYDMDMYIFKVGVFKKTG